MLCNSHPVMKHQLGPCRCSSRGRRDPSATPRGKPAPSSRVLGRGLPMPTVKCEVFHTLGPRGGFLFSQYSFPWGVRAGKGQLRGAGTYRLQAGGHASCSLVRS